MDKSLAPENLVYFHVFVPNEVKIRKVKITRGMIVQMCLTCLSTFMILGMCLVILGNSKYSRIEICVANFIPPTNGSGKNLSAKCTIF